MDASGELHINRILFKSIFAAGRGICVWQAQLCESELLLKVFFCKGGYTVEALEFLCATSLCLQLGCVYKCTQGT